MQNPAGPLSSGQRAEGRRPPTTRTPKGRTRAPSRPAPDGSEEVDLRVVCLSCWNTFEDWSRDSCPDCGVHRPRDGFAQLPYLFRGRYLFTEPLGRGGMGTVFLASDQQRKHGPKVAVKVVAGSAIPLIREMFEREAAAAAILAQSPYFVRVLSHDVGAEPAYLAMEFVDWPTLADCLDKAKRRARTWPFTPLMTARIGIALLRGVASMHFHRIVHRDLKPENVFLRRATDGEYEIKLMDLGVWTHDERANVVPNGATRAPAVARKDDGLVGTFSYMSPEQMETKPVGATSDVHSVGSVLWELATGDAPYPIGPGGEANAIRDRLERLQVPPKRPDDMPEGLYEILIRALAFRPEDRWDSAEEMRLALKVWEAEERLRREGSSAPRQESLESASFAELLAPTDDLHPSRDLLARSGRWLRELTSVLSVLRERATPRVRMIAGSGALVALGLAILVGLLTIGRRGERASEPAASVVRAPEEMLRGSPPLSAASAVLAKPAPGSRPPQSAGTIRATAKLATWHGPGPLAVAISRDGALAASAGASGIVQIWNVERGERALAVGGDGAAVSALAFSPDKKILAVVTLGGAIELLSVETGARTARVSRSRRSRVNALAFSPDGRWLASGSDSGDVRLHARGKGREVKLEPPPDASREESAVRSLAFSRDGATLAVATAGGQITIWDLEKRERLRVLQGASQADDRTAIALAPKGEILIAKQGDLVWLDAVSGERARAVNAGAPVHALACSPEGLIAAGGADGSLRVLELEPNALTPSSR